MQQAPGSANHRDGGGQARSVSRLGDAASLLLVILLAYGLPVLGTLASGAETVLPGSPAELLWAALMSTALSCTLVIALQSFLHQEPLSALTGGYPALRKDLGRALLLTLALILGAYCAQELFSRLGGSGTPEVLLKLGRACRDDPRMLAAMLGPVVWIQAAFTEELTRAFILRRCGRLWPGAAGGAISLFGVSVVFGAAHLYQGAAGILGTFVIGLVLGWGYLRWQRLWPPLLAHALYDTLALLILVYAQAAA